MKKLITLLLVLCAGVMNVSATDYLKGSWNWGTPIEFSYDGLGTATVSLAAATTYEFGLDNGGTWCTNSGTMIDTNCIGWQFAAGSGNAKITTTIAGDYTFKVEWKEVESKWYPYISVVYPTSNTYTIHFKIGGGWSSVYAYRYFVTTDVCETKWGGTILSENANNSGYYDLTFNDTYNRIVFNDNGSDTYKSSDVVVDFENLETWVTDNATTTSTAPSGWVGYTRTVTEGNFGTICLPFAATVTGATVYQITSKVMDGETLTGINLTSVDALEAGKAYIFKATGNTLTATYSGSYTAATEANGMKGNLSSNAATVEAGNYIVSGNQLHKVTGDEVTCGQYKAYVTLTGISAGARGLDFIAFDDATGIETLNAERGTLNDGVYYNLKGQRVAQPTKGLYIVNGRKVVVK